jgi:predicted ATP-grasp superfamily ATP-dependent carboligase
MTARPPVILLGLDTAVGLVAMRELGRRRVPVIGVGYHDAAVGRGSRYLTDFLVRPEGPLAAWLPRLVERFGAGAVLPLRDRDIVEVSAIPALPCVNLGGPAQAMALVMDKARTMDAAQRVGIEIPHSWQPAVADEAPPPGLGWPVVLKWADPLPIAPALARLGLPDLKAEYCTGPESLRGALARYRPLGRYPIVQEYARGRGLGQTLYIEAGKATLRFQHERVHEWPPEGGVSSLCRALPLSAHAEQMALSEALLAAIGWEGYAMVEYRHDPATGRCVLMEVNGHLWGSLALASACGAEFAWEAYRRRVLGHTEPAAAPRTGLSARDLVKETRRLPRLFAGRSSDPCFRPTPWSDLARYLAGFLDPRVRPYVFAWSDPLPAFLSLGATFVRALRRPSARARSRTALAKGRAR